MNSKNYMELGLDNSMIEAGVWEKLDVPNRKVIIVIHNRASYKDD